MQTIFTPWRFSYISMSDPQQGCFFCHAVDDPEAPDSLLLWLGEHFMVMLNRYPYTNGHLMVAPLEHLADPQSSSKEATAEFWPLVLRCQRILQRAYSPHGFNMGLNLGTAGGAGVPGHYHFHVVPRWNGDTNFMTVVGDARVVPEEPSEVLRKLRPIFEAEES